MNFSLAPLLLFLFLIPVFVVAYVALHRRRVRRSQTLATQGFAPTEAALKLRKRRHIPFAFFLAGLTALLFSLARPAVARNVSKQEGSVILAFDVSNSMRANDLKPTRMDAAKAAARLFVAKQPKNIKIGVVAFNEGGVVTQTPTDDRAAVLGAIKRLKSVGGTSIGQGIFSSLNAIAGKAIALDVEALKKSLNAPDGAATIEIGYYGSSAIVLLSDGEDTSSFKPVSVAQLASSAGVAIHTVGIGSTDGTTFEVDGFKLAATLDEATLKEISKVTNGKYFLAEDSKTLENIYSDIKLGWKSERQPTEITSLFTGFSALMFAIGGALSLRWFGRVV
jgi:Ca-activated chloride channel homolog